MSAESPQSIALKRLEQVMNRWFSRWDRDVARLVLCPGIALDLDLPPIWVMVVGPPGGGKTEISVELARSYDPHVATSNLSEAGLLSMEKGTKGKGILQQMYKKKTVWTISDFSSVTSLREETRAAIASALREIYDGKWSRHLRGTEQLWEGTCGLVAACTNAIEKFHKLQKDLGDRFVQARIGRIESIDLRAKASAQQRHKQQVRDALREAGKGLLLAHNGLPKMSDEVADNIARLADFCAYARQPISRDYRGQVCGADEAESGGRLWQQFSSIAQADACLMGQKEVGKPQLDLLLRVAIDSAPLGRARILKQLCSPEYPDLPRSVLVDQGGFDYDLDAARAFEELTISKLILKSETGYSIGDRALGYLAPVLS